MIFKKNLLLNIASIFILSTSFINAQVTQMTISATNLQNQKVSMIYQPAKKIAKVCLTSSPKSCSNYVNVHKLTNTQAKTYKLKKGEFKIATTSTNVYIGKIAPKKVRRA